MRTELNEDAVLAAMQSVLSRGEYPSQARVRDELGSTASAQTIGRMVAAGYKRLSGGAAPDGAASLPPYVIQAATRLHHEISEQETSQARQAIEAAEAKAAEQQLALTQARQAHDETREQMAYLRQAHDAAIEQRDALAENLEAQRTASVADRQRIADLEDRLTVTRRDAAQTLRRVRATHRQQLEAQTQASADLASELDWIKRYSEDERDRLAGEIDRERQALKAAEAQDKERGREIQVQRATHEQAEQAWADQRRELEQRLTASEAAVRDAQQSLTVCVRESERLQTELEALRAEGSRYQQALSETQAELVTVCRSRDVAQALAEERRDQLKRLADAGSVPQAPDDE